MSEIELKLEVEPGATQELRSRPWIEAAQGTSQRQSSVYFDTPDGELRTRGYTLRVRSAGDRFIQTVKSLDTCAALFERGEWEHEVDGPEPDGSLLADTPLAGINHRQLRPVIRSEVERTACRFRSNGAEVELDVDEGTVSASGYRLPIHEIEIELVSGEAGPAIELARRVAGEVPVKLGVLSKAERGFALIDGALAKAVRGEPVALQPEMNVAEGFEAIVTACLRHFRLNEPLVIERRTPEALHQSRVAMRRLRSALTLFRPALKDSEFDRIGDELRWFTKQLGEARNLDVFLERPLPDAESEQLKRRRERAYDLVIAAMNSPRLRALMIDLVAWVALGEWRNRPKARVPLRPYADRRIGRLVRRINKTRRMGRMAPNKRHKLRIRIKDLRYALDFTQNLHQRRPGRRKKFAKSIRRVQNRLGELNDLAVGRKLAAAAGWPMPRKKKAERKLLRKADRALGRLRKAQPYWGR